MAPEKRQELALRRQAKQQRLLSVDDVEVALFVLTQLKLAVISKQHLPTAQHLILLGAQVRPADFPASANEMRRQLMAWAEDHLSRHRVVVYAIRNAHRYPRQRDSLTRGPR